MRTKSLILMAVVGVVSAASTFAQTSNNVYSVNAVGYVNKSLVPGFNLIANPLNASPSNTISQLFPSVPLGSRVFRYNNGSFSITTFETDDFGVDGWNNPNLPLNPGEGFFFQNNRTTNIAVTFVGEVPQGPALTNPLNAGFNLKASIVPQSGRLDTVLGYPASIGDRVFRYNTTRRAYDFSTYETDDFGVAGWNNVAVATPDVAEGFFLFTQAAKNWTRNFSANN